MLLYSTKRVMDLAYDHIQEEAYPKDGKGSKDTPKPDQEESSLNNDLQDAYKAISSSAWGLKIGGFLGNVMKQVSCRCSVSFSRMDTNRNVRENLYMLKLRRSSPRLARTRRKG